MAIVLIIDDDAALRDGLAETLGDLGHEARIATSGREGLAVLTEDIDIVLLDLRMPGGLDGIEVLRRIRARDSAPPVVILTAYASSENTIEAMRIGAFDHLAKPIGREELRQLLLRLPSRAISPTSPVRVSPDTLIGSSDGIRRMQKAIGLAADSAATVLIFGETGTGKEMVARALHVHSRRADRPFIAVNCAAIPEDLLESELFGHVKGSFTGATTDRTGAFVEAGGGTVLLDEIGDMPLAMQAKILRALQEKVVTPVGGKPVATDARIIAATHRDLPELVAAKAFREDLYYRLNVIPIVVPPLRERPSDIMALAEHFLVQCSSGGRIKKLSAEACDKLKRHGWRGNVRELRNVIERACVLTRSDLIGPDDLDTTGDQAQLPPRAAAADADLPSAVAQLEEAMIRRALEASGGNRTEAARRLSINRQLLYAKMQRYGLAGEASANPTEDVSKDDA
jgi:two-component system NtrC family response regulator